MWHLHGCHLTKPSLEPINRGLVSSIQHLPLFHCYHVGLRFELASQFELSLQLSLHASLSFHSSFHGSFHGDFQMHANHLVAGLAFHLHYQSSLLMHSHFHCIHMLVQLAYLVSFLGCISFSSLNAFNYGFIHNHFLRCYSPHVAQVHISSSLTFANPLKRFNTLLCLGEHTKHSPHLNTLIRPLMGALVELQRWLKDLICWLLRVAKIKQALVR